MASGVDATVPADNVQPDKADMRRNFLVIYNEITALQSKTSQAGQMAYSDASFDSL